MRYLFLVFFAAFANAALAQDDTNNAGEVKTPEELADTRRFGLQGLLGFNAAQLDGDYMAGYHHFGINGGLRAYIRLAPKFTTSLGIVYTQTGAQVNRLDIRSNLRTIDLDYIQIPLMVHYSDWRVQAGLGLSYNRLMNSRIIELNGLDVTATAFGTKIRDFDIVAHIEASVFFTKHWALNMQYSPAIMNTDSRSPIFVDIRTTNLYLYAHHITARALYNF
jgi:Outer membrane protein beta-barrel domain